MLFDAAQPSAGGTLGRISCGDTGMGQRKYSRVAVELVCEIETADRAVYYGETHDLSADGVFVTLPSPPLRTGQACRVRLHIQLEGQRRRIDVQAEVMRRADDGVGLRFTAADTGGYTRLLGLLLADAPDVGLILEEIGRQPGAGFRLD
jgi:hypothetical protein